MSKHTTLFPSSKDLEAVTILKERPEPQSETDESEVKSKKRKVLEKPFKPAKLPLKVHVTKNEHACQQANPWENYQELCSDNEGGDAIIAFKTHHNHHIVAVKSRPLQDDWDIGRIRYLDHRNIVTLIEAFKWRNSLFFIYESIGLSLADILRCPYGPLKEFEIASICKGVLQGILYIEGTARVACPVLNSDNILIDDSGNVMIANVGDSLVKNDSRNSSNELGGLLFEILEPGSAILDCQNRKLSTTSEWSEMIRDFLHATEVDRPGQLDSVSDGLKNPLQEFEDILTCIKHRFLETSPGPACLKPYIDITRRAFRPSTLKPSVHQMI